MDRTDGVADRLTKVRQTPVRLAEKLQAMIVAGMRNSRMKDCFDIWVLLRQASMISLPAQAIRATCERRGTALPDSWPIGLDHEFAADASKLAQWHAFLRKNRLDAAALAEVFRELQIALARPLETARG